MELTIVIVLQKMKYGKYHCNSASKNEIWKIPLHIRILDVVRLVHGYFIFVFLIINMLS
jgi:hypothetical protein